MRLRTLLARAIPAGLLALALPVVSHAQTLPAGTVHSGSGFAIRNNWVTTSSIDLTGEGSVPLTGQNVYLRLIGLVGADAGDLRARLTYTPTGSGTVTRSAEIMPFAPGGMTGQRSFDGTYVFGSTFTATLPGGAVAPGEFAAPGLSDAFNGVALAGKWMLVFEDHLSSGNATLQSWDLIVAGAATTTAPEPASVALVGSGLVAVALLRRRRRVAGDAIA